MPALEQVRIEGEKKGRGGGEEGALLCVDVVACAVTCSVACVVTVCCNGML